MTTRALYQIFLKHPRICTDTRQLQPGDFFVALRGERFDGNQYAARALELGAARAMVDNPAVVTSKAYILTDDCLTTLQELATWHRRQFRIPVIAITGSNGKTTTKELVRDVLARTYKVHATSGNYNNHIGVPLTLLAMPPETDIAVIEMGANAQGEIHQLCTIAEPNFGIITNFGRAHLEGFGGVEGIRIGKSELYRYLHGHGGTAFVNKDEILLETYLPSGTAKVTYATAEKSYSQKKDYGVERLMDGEKIGFRFINAQGEISEGITELFGRFHFGNVATAIAVGLHFGVSSSAITDALESYRPEMMRSQIIRAGRVHILLDAYNANPDSMEGALASFPSFEGPSPRIAILGDMLELGDDSRTEHANVVSLSDQAGLDYLLLVGPQFEEADLMNKGLHFASVDEVAEWWKKAGIQEATILIKGSRRWKLERFIEKAALLP